jgi:GT2 family glycosyltransferase
MISAVMPTYNRLPALQANFGSLLALAGVEEIVVVVDGSTDGSAQWLRGLGERRVRVIEQENRGSPAARNRGVAEARGDWILSVEDDCWLPPDFAGTLLAVADRTGAQIVGAPWLQIDHEREIEPELAAGRARARSRIRLGTSPVVFPDRDLETPFLNGIVLARHEVLAAVPYDESYDGIAWREETSLFLTALGRGYKCVFTPDTAAFQLGQWAGGQRRPPLAYELSALRNNWRFLRRHRRALQQLGEIRTPVTAQLAFIYARVRQHGRGWLLARLGRD